METNTAACKTLMLDFAATTGLLATGVPTRRYLWTDAFAVCNFLELHRRSGEPSYLQLALKLVDQVHQVLGKHRADSGKQGWLSGLDEDKGLLHPTCGGLRIGKPLNERQPVDNTDTELEWQQDGQYFHYLTRWMHALNCVAASTGETRYLHWAMELAQTAHAAFTGGSAGARRLYWKMSVDLSRPLVTSMGQHDALDGLVICLQLESSAKRFPEQSPYPDLHEGITDLLDMCRGGQWATRDPLGIGGLLLDSHGLFGLAGKTLHSGLPAVADLLWDTRVSLQAYRQYNQLQHPAGTRLAFRELGLAIGLQVLDRMQQQLRLCPERFEDCALVQRRLSELSEYLTLHPLVERFWLQEEHQAALSWQQHKDINSVMLATCLAPDTLIGFGTGSADVLAC